MKQTQHLFEQTIEKNVALQYLLYLPKGYKTQSANRWPMILFLHGMGERGDNLDLIKEHGLPKIVETHDIPFIVISPQCPAHTTWMMVLDALYALTLDAIQTNYVDRSRIYLTGLSMGGFGTWHLAEAYPPLFAALIPICGGVRPPYGDPERIKVLKDTPIWVFHGAQDDIVPLQNSQELVDILKKHDGNVRFTIYPDAGHDSWTQTYENPEIYTWLLSHSKHANLAS